MLTTAVCFVFCGSVKNSGVDGGKSSKHSGHEYVDLGLPSGAKWAVEDVLDGGSPFFAWGEAASKPSYGIETYRHASASDKKIVKYCTDAATGHDGLIDGKLTIEAADDAANVIWGGKWSVPNNDEWTELYDGCTWTTTSDGSGNIVFVGKSKTNGREIRFVSRGMQNADKVTFAGKAANYWTSELFTQNCLRASAFQFTEKATGLKMNGRSMGHCVRAVIPGDRNMLKYVDLGLPSGTKWAKANVGAAAPDSAGLYISWGEILPKKAESYVWSESNYKWGGATKLKKYCTDNTHGVVDNKAVLDMEDDAAYAYMGAGWRLPSREQVKELLDNCIWTYDASRVGQIVTGPNGNSIFLPYAGTIYNGATEFNKVRGFYWTCELDSVNGDNYGTGLFVAGEKAAHTFGNKFSRASGRSIRGVYNNK